MNAAIAHPITGPAAWRGAELARSADSKALPAGLEVLWGSIEAGALRGGTAQAR
jgi:hypothetical protein